MHGADTSSAVIGAPTVTAEVRPIEHEVGIRGEESIKVAPPASIAAKEEQNVEYSQRIEMPQAHTLGVDQKISLEPFSEAEIAPDLKHLPSVKLPNLNIEEVRAIVLKDSHIIDIGARVDRSAEIVYGDASVMQSFKAQALQSRDAAVSAHNTIKGNPEQIAPLAGTSASFWRKASPERVEAERNVNDLANTVARYGNDYHYEIEKIQEEHRQEQSRQRVEIPAPSPRLAEMLSLKSEEQAAAMVTAPELKAELSHLIEAMRQRLTHVEHRALNEGKMQVVAKALHIDEEAAQRLSSVYSQVNQAEAVVRQQRRLEQSKGLGLSI